jgi:hypothetical protein
MAPRGLIPRSSGADRTYLSKPEKGTSYSGLEITAKLATRSWGRAVQCIGYIG